MAARLGAAVAVLLTVGLCCDLQAQTQGDQLSALKARLDELLGKYTGFHPEVVRLKREIQLLEKEQGPVSLTQTDSQLSIAVTNSKGPATANASSPSHDEIMKRALRKEIASASAPVVVPLTPSAESASKPATTTPIDEVKTPSEQPSLTSSAAATSSSNTSNGVPAAVAVVPVASAAAGPATSSTTVGSAPSETSEIVKPANVQPKKGPVFSPLPADLTPTNQTLKISRGSQTPEANNSMETLDDKHFLAIGDRLSFRIVEDEEDPRSLTVMDSGELEVPYIGRFYAVGHSCRDLAKALKTELEKDYYYNATVIVAVDLKAKSRGKVYLSGAVRLPGAQEIPSDETFTLSKAILCAGGFTDFADKKKVKISRKAADGVNEDHITVDVTEILERGRTSADVTLLAGDQIYVPERLIRF